MNQVTHPFAYPVPLGDYAVQGIDTEANYFIKVDIDSGYLWLVAEEEAQKILYLFTPYGKRRWKVIPMGDLNADQICLAIIVKLQM